MVKLVYKTGRNNENIRKCAYYQYMNQERNPNYGTSHGKDKGAEAFLKKNNLEPGKLIISDQY